LILLDNIFLLLPKEHVMLSSRLVALVLALSATMQLTVDIQMLCSLYDQLF
jgi:hypothetical protein